MPSPPTKRPKGLCDMTQYLGIALARLTRPHRPNGRKAFATRSPGATTLAGSLPCPHRPNGRKAFATRTRPWLEPFVLRPWCPHRPNGRKAFATFSHCGFLVLLHYLVPTNQTAERPLRLEVLRLDKRTRVRSPPTKWPKGLCAGRGSPPGGTGLGPLRWAGNSEKPGSSGTKQLTGEG